MRTTNLLSVGAALVLGASLAIAARAPLAFKTVASLTDAPLPAFDPRGRLDIAGIVRAIPDRGPEGTADAVYAAHPAERYRRSVVEGFGNCSNLVKGLSWGLLRDGHDFEVVYVFPVESILTSGGHTLLRSKLELPEGPRVALADIAAAAIPREGARALDVGDFVGSVPAVHLDPLRPESEDWSVFYTEQFLGDVVIGRTSSAETARWFRVLEAIHVDLGQPEKLDKIVYAGIGAVLGELAPIHVDDLERVRSRHGYVFAQMNAAIWGMRVAPLVLLGCGLVRLVLAVRGRSRRPECRDLVGAAS